MYKNIQKNRIKTMKFGENPNIPNRELNKPYYGIRWRMQLLKMNEVELQVLIQKELNTWIKMFKANFRTTF